MVRAVFEKSWRVLARGSNGIPALEPLLRPQISVISFIEGDAERRAHVDRNQDNSFQEKKNTMTSEELNEYLIGAQETLAGLMQLVDDAPEIGLGLQNLLKAGPSIMTTFQRMTDEKPEIAHRVLMSSVSALVNMHVVREITDELQKRVEGN